MRTSVLHIPAPALKPAFAAGASAYGVVTRIRMTPNAQQLAT